MTHVGARLWNHPMVNEVDPTTTTNDEPSAREHGSEEVTTPQPQPGADLDTRNAKQHRLALTDLAAQSQSTLALDPVARQELASIASAFENAAGDPVATEQLKQEWKGFVSNQLELGADVDQLMLELKRQACSEKKNDLEDFADRIRLNQQLRRQANKEMMRARDILNQSTGGALAVPFEPNPIEINPANFTSASGQLVDVDGTEFLMPPDLYHSHGVEEAIEVLNESAVAETREVSEVPEERPYDQPDPPDDPFAVARCRGNKCNPSNLADAPHLKLAINAIIAQGIRKPEDIVKALEEQFGIKATATTVTDEDGRSYKAVDFGNGKLLCDGNGNGGLDSGDYNFKGALEDVEARFGISAEVFAQMAPQYIQEQLTKMEAAFAGSGKDFPKDQLARIFALAFVLSAEEMILTKSDLQNYVDGLEATLSNLADNEDSTNQDIQQALWEQQAKLFEAGDLFHILYEAANELDEEKEAKTETDVEAGSGGGEITGEAGDLGQLGQLNG